MEYIFHLLGFPHGSDGKESTCTVGDLDSIAGAQSDFCLDFHFFPEFPAQASLITHPCVAGA